MLLDMNDIFKVVILVYAPPLRVPKLDFFYFAHEDFAIGVVVSIPVLNMLAICHHIDRFAGRAILFCPFLCGGKTFALNVGLHPEVGEEEEEEDAVHQDQADPQGVLIVTLFHKVVLADVNGDQNELRELDSGHVLLPPQVFLEARPGSREAVVGVHDNMDCSIHHGMEAAHSCSRRQGDAPPPGPGHDGVMEDVEKCDLSLLLSQHKERCVEEFDEF